MTSDKINSTLIFNIILFFNENFKCNRLII